VLRRRTKVSTPAPRVEGGVLSCVAMKHGGVVVDAVGRVVWILRGGNELSIGFSRSGATADLTVHG